jgi:hypothetical protein
MVLWTTVSGFKSLPPSQQFLQQQRLTAFHHRSLIAGFWPRYRPRDEYRQATEIQQITQHFGKVLDPV